MFSRIKKKKVKGITFRSMFESEVCKKLMDNKIFFEYETLTIPFSVPESYHTYVPDVVLGNGIIIEIKGQLTLANRDKHLYIQRQLPKLDIRFVLQNSKSKLYKGSKTTYAQWLDKHNFLWADKVIPQEWIDERPKEEPDRLFIKRKSKPYKYRSLDQYRKGKS